MRLLTGRVASFDEADGWGTVEAEDGSSLPFHSTAIADGTRRIEAGAAVSYRVRPGRMGRWEADQLAPLGP